MKALAVGAKDLPWLSPSAATLRTLARSPLAAAWLDLRHDPGLVVLLARAWRRRPLSLNHSVVDRRVLRAALRQLHTTPQAGWVDWHQPSCRTVYESALRQAQLTAGLAELLPHCDPHRAWVGGMLASLGWLVTCAVHTNHAPDARSVDSPALARRVGHAWRLPAWLAAIAGRLALPVETAVRLGADPVLFQLVQLAVLLQQRDGTGLGLAVGAELGELVSRLHLHIDQAEAVAERVAASALPECTWEAPAAQPLLPDLLDLAWRHRRHDADRELERLHRDIDRLQDGLAARRTDASRQLEVLKVTALAEFAAGAGHEINNPLAVISGQAQYLLRQLNLLDGPAEEIDNPLEYLLNLRGEIVPSLHKIIGQTQRVHGILTELMQFARPAPPVPQALDAAALVADVSRALQPAADARSVHLICDEPASGIMIHADPQQAQTALAALLRNAIEAAPAGGWAGIRIEAERDGRTAFLVEDNGPGPGPVAQQHLFDPFFSGRAAGRGRGLGLPTAWRLASQQDGELRFEGSRDGVTRFRLTLPTAEMSAPQRTKVRRGA